MIYAAWACVLVPVLFGIVFAISACMGSSRASRYEDEDQLEQELAFGIDREMRETQRAAREVA